MGNTQQNIANLLALATANANSSQSWAKWRTTSVNSAKVPANLLIWVPNVPGYLAPAGAAGAR